MRGKTGADREISVNTYTGGFTTMLNHHLRNRNLSLPIGTIPSVDLQR